MEEASDEEAVRATADALFSSRGKTLWDSSYSRDTARLPKQQRRYVA